MSSSYHSKVRDLLKTRQSCFSFAWAMDVLFSQIWVKPAKVSTVNSDLTNIVDVNVFMKTINELCISNKV